ncbi:HDOD domain-containing protein [bacterium]|nr:HDOD domain-containing protein [bacterium]
MDSKKIEVFIDNLKKNVSKIDIKSELEKVPENHIQHKQSKDDLAFIKYIESLDSFSTIPTPLFSETAIKIIQLSNGSDYSISEISNLIKSDPFLVLNILKLANSVTYRGAYPIVDINQAISRIGMEELIMMIMTLYFKNSFLNTPFSSEYAQFLWKHSTLTALISSQLAPYLNYKNNNLYTLGLLHKIGALTTLYLVDSFKKREQIDYTPKSRFIVLVAENYNKKLTEIILKPWEFPVEQVESILNCENSFFENSSLDYKLLNFATIVSKLIFNDSWSGLNEELKIYGYQYLWNSLNITLEFETVYMMIQESFKSYFLIQKLINEIK